MRSVLVAAIAIVLAIATQSAIGQTTELEQNGDNYTSTTNHEENATATTDHEDYLSTTNGPNTNNSRNVSFKGQKDQLSQYKSYVFTWKINSIEELISNNGSPLESPLFPVFGYPYNAKAKLVIKDGNINASLAFVDEDNDGVTIPFKVLPKVTYTLRDLNGDGYDGVQSEEYSFLSTLQFNDFNYVEYLCDTDMLADSVYDANDTIVIDIAIDPPSVANAIASTDGTIAVEIDNYSWRKQREVDGSEYFTSSPYFRTAPGGYRLNVAMHLYGYGSNENVGLTAEIVFLSSENDDDLGLSFPHIVTVIVFNQLDSTKHFVKTAWHDLKTDCDYFVDLLTHDDFENNGFLVDDTFYYKVIIQRSSH